MRTRNSAPPVVQNGDRLLAGIPLALRRVRRFGAALTLGEIVGTGPVPTRGMGLADKVDLVVREGASAAGIRLQEALIDLLERVDVLDLKGISESSALGSSLTGVATHPLQVRTQERSVSPYLPLDAGWDD